MLQIDALAYAELRRAIELGYCPTIERMVREEGYTLRRWFCDSTISRLMTSGSHLLDYGTAVTTIPLPVWRAVAIREVSIPGAGEADYLLHIMAETMAELDALLRRDISRLPGVRRTVTSMITREIKDASSVVEALVKAGL